MVILKIRWSLKPPGYIVIDEILDDIWQGIISIAWILIHIINSLLNLGTLGFYGFILNCIGVIHEKKHFSNIEGYEIFLFGKKIYEKKENDEN